MFFSFLNLSSKKRREVDDLRDFRPSSLVESF